MAWQKYELVFRLHSPLHVGWRKAGNLMQTRGYLPGKNQWAALTARLTRDYDNGAEGQNYVKIGRRVHDYFRFTYLYPATEKDAGYQIHYPWDDDFDYLFLDSYTSTALDHTTHAAADAMLHEIEFIAPVTRDSQPVYLTGSLYVRTDLPTPLEKWPEALKMLQVGAERGYGWGRLQLISCKKQDAPFTCEPHAAPHNDRITAHLKAKDGTNIRGPIEPLVGWERNNDRSRKSAWKLGKQAAICYAPGAKVTGERDFTIGRNGIWEEAAD